MAKKLNSTNVGTSKASASMSAGKKTTKRTTRPTGGAGKPKGTTMKNTGGSGKKSNALQKNKRPGPSVSVGTQGAKSGSYAGKTAQGARTSKVSLPKGSKGSGKTFKAQRASKRSK